jgi:hypothetical protein
MHEYYYSLVSTALHTDYMLIKAGYTYNSILDMDFDEHRFLGNLSTHFDKIEDINNKFALTNAQNPSEESIKMLNEAGKTIEANRIRRGITSV